MEEAAKACALTEDWLRNSSWNATRAFQDAPFRLEAFSLADVLEFRTCWHTGTCARFSSGIVDKDGGSGGILDIAWPRLQLPLTIMACSAEVLLARWPGKYLQFVEVLKNPADLVAMDGNHRLAALAARARRGIADPIGEVRVFVTR